MPEHHDPLIATITGGLALAYLFGLAAHKLRISPIVGYLLAGVAIGPFTPGFVADQGLANQLAEIGVILLMFAVGLHFSLQDLLSVARIAVPGAAAQMAVATALGLGLGLAFGWGLGGALVFGLALSVASTVVLTRALQERRLLESERGHIAVGWLVVQDLAMVLALVLIPAIGGKTVGSALASALGGGLTVAIALTLAKVAAFVGLMVVVGRRAIPWLLHLTAHTGSRELFRLAVYAVALGVAFGAAELFEVSFALGAFAAGMVLGDSPLSQRATEEALPLRDAFAVLFFVSVGMLFNPHIIVDAPLAVLVTVLIIILGQSAVAFLILRLRGQPSAVALTISASLAQIGEFSFILAELGVGMAILPPQGRDLILAGAIASILLNPVLFAFAERRRAHSESTHVPAAAAPAAEPAEPTALSGHDVLVGYGRVGSLVGRGLLAATRPLLVIEDREDQAEAARRDGAEVVHGNAADPQILRLAGLEQAGQLFVTVPEAFEAGQVVQQARAANPALIIIARAHSDAALAHLAQLGADVTVSGEREIAHRMLERATRPEPALAQPALAKPEVEGTPGEGLRSLSEAQGDGHERIHGQVRPSRPGA